MKKTRRILGLFGNFDEATNAIYDIRASKIAGLSVDDVTLISPIEQISKFPLRIILYRKQ